MRVQATVDDGLEISVNVIFPLMDVSKINEISMIAETTYDCEQRNNETIFVAKFLSIFEVEEFINRLMMATKTYYHKKDYIIEHLERIKDIYGGN